MKIVRWDDEQKATTADVWTVAGGSVKSADGKRTIVVTVLVDGLQWEASNLNKNEVRARARQLRDEKLEAASPKVGASVEGEQYSREENYYWDGRPFPGQLQF
ncbi:MAG: hypothetical protein ACE5H0_09535 [Bacteroidota bacterium]